MQYHVSMVSSFVVIALIGVVIGIFSGLLGIGGGTVMVPVFRLVLGMSPIASTATSLFIIIPTSVSGAITHIRGKTCVLKLGIALGIGGACTSPFGVWLAQHSPGWLIMVAAAAVIGYSAFTMLRKALKMPRTSPVQDSRAYEIKQASQEEESGGTEVAEPAALGAGMQLGAKDMAKAFGIGAIAGVASGYVGLGGGFIMVPLMMTLFNMPMRLTSGTSLIAVMLLATPGAITQCMLGNVDYLAGVAMACGSIPGALLGSKLVKRVPERLLRFVFAAFLGVAAILLIVKELGALA